MPLDVKDYLGPDRAEADKLCAKATAMGADCEVFLRGDEALVRINDPCYACGKVTGKPVVFPGPPARYSCFHKNSCPGGTVAGWLASLGGEVSRSDLEGLARTRPESLFESPALSCMANLSAGEWAVTRDALRASLGASLCGQLDKALKNFVKERARESRPVEVDPLRCVVMNGRELGYYMRTAEGDWVAFSSTTINAKLVSRGLEPYAERDKASDYPWEMVNEPFAPEELPGRKWNLAGARWAVAPAAGECPTWDFAWNHLGKGLDEAAREAGFSSGGEYLWLWCAFLAQRPKRRLPYLFFFSKEQGTGKSSFHECLMMLLERGYTDAEVFLKGDFSADVAGAVLAYIDEAHISQQKYPKLKKILTADEIQCHPKGIDPYMVRNTTHCVHTSNNPGYVPIDPEDTRIVVIEVPPLEVALTEGDFKARALSEAPQALNKMLTMELPAEVGRLQLPVLVTEAKLALMDAARSPLERFMEQEPGWMFLTLAEIQDALPDRRYWTEARIRREMGVSGAAVWQVAQVLRPGWQGTASDLPIDLNPKTVGRALRAIPGVVEDGFRSGVRVWRFDPVG